MEDSIFTKIIKGEIPCHTIYEDDRTLAFLDIHPKSEGQTVVVPKTQVPFIWDLDDTDYQALMAAVQKVGKRLVQAFPDKKRVGVTVEGLDVDNHAHVVVLPFDTVSEYQGLPIETSNETLAALAERLRLQA